MLKISAQTSALSIILLLVVLALVLSACAGNTAALRVDPATEQQLRLGLPPVDSLRNLSSPASMFLTGDESSLKSSGAVEGLLFDVQLKANDGGPFEWAIYTFEPGPGELIDLEVQLTQLEAADRSFIGLANFDSLAWDFSGPFSEAEPLLTFDAANRLSPEGRLFVVVVAPVGSDFNISQLILTRFVNDPPQADIQADQSGGDVPLLVSFDASASSDPDGTIVKFEWDFNGDGSFELDTGTSSITSHNYLFGGVFNAAVRVTDDGGSSTIANTQLLVAEAGNVPPTALLQADVTEGEAGIDFEVNFTSSSSTDLDGSITLYEWDLDSDGTFEKSSPTPDAQTFTYTIPGEPQARLRVTDNEGAQRVDTVKILAHGWISVTVDDFQDTGKSPSLLMLGKFPAIAYVDFTDNAVKYAVSDNPDGTEAVEWNLLTIDGPNDSFGNLSLKIVEGTPAICYQDKTNKAVRYRHCSTELGKNPADWSTLVTLESGGDQEEAPILQVVAGNPAIAFVTTGTVKRLKYVRSTSPNGQLAADWPAPVILKESDDFFGEFEFSQAAGRPNVVYKEAATDNLMYILSSTVEGSALADWLPEVAVSDCDDVGGQPSLITLAGVPALAFYDAPDNSNGDLQLVISSSPDGALATDWGPEIIVDGPNEVGGSPFMTLVNGLPAIVYLDDTNSSLRLARSSSASGSQSADWSSEPVPDSFGARFSMSMTDNNGRPAIAYFTTDGNDLRYAIRF